MAETTAPTVLVTGAAQGIGKAIAEAFAQKGAQLILFDLSEKVHEVAASLGPGTSATAVQIDVTDPESVRDAVGQFERIDVLVNSAGVVRLAPAETLTLEDWDTTMSVNLRACFIVARTVGQKMIAQKYGRIINLASQASIVALAQHVAYCASKAALVGMTRVLALEWAEHNITVNAVAPTVVLTELGKQAWSGEKGRFMMEKIPLKRFAQPEEIAAAALFLAGDGANMITGQMLVVDGGYTVQ